MPLSRDEQERVRGWLQGKASSNSLDRDYALAALEWIAELGSPFQGNNPGPVVNETPRDTMIQIRFRAKRSTVSISELPDETKD